MIGKEYVKNNAEAYKKPQANMQQARENVRIYSR